MGGGVRGSSTVVGVAVGVRLVPLSRCDERPIPRPPRRSRGEGEFGSEGVRFSLGVCP